MSLYPECPYKHVQQCAAGAERVPCEPVLVTRMSVWQ